MTIVYGENATVGVVVNDTRATGNVTVKVNGKEFNATLGTNGTVNVTIACENWTVDVYGMHRACGYQEN